MLNSEIQAFMLPRSGLNVCGGGTRGDICGTRGDIRYTWRYIRYMQRFGVETNFSDQLRSKMINRLGSEDPLRHSGYSTYNLLSNLLQLAQYCLYQNLSEI